jgi:hypothetical protein
MRSNKELLLHGLPKCSVSERFRLSRQRSSWLASVSVDECADDVTPEVDPAMTGDPG